MAASLCLALLALGCWQVLLDGPLLTGDRRLAARLRDAGADAVGPYQLLADLGELAFALPVFALAVGWLLLRARAWWAVCCGVLACGCAPVVVSLLKWWTDRPGPLGGTGYFPSGHAATATVVFGGAALLLARHGGAGGSPLPPAVGSALWAAATVLTAANGVGLVARGYHWPLDVLASWCLATVLLIGASTAARRAPPPHGRRRRVDRDRA